VVFHLLARELGLSAVEALAGCVILALNPAYVFLSLLAMSDIVSSVWTTLAVLAALRARRRPGWALGSGAAFAIACLVRPANVLLVPALALALPWTVTPLLRFALGAAPGFALLFACNQHAFGHPLRTGYQDVPGQFALGYFRSRFNHYTHWLGKTFTPLVPLAWLAVLTSRDTRWWDRWLLLVWFGSYFFFHCFYFHHDQWWYLRFLLPGFPPLVIGALLAARPLWRELDLRVRLTPIHWTSASLLPLLLFAFVVQREVKVGVDRELFTIAEAEAIFPRAVHYAASKLPERAVVLSFLMSGSLEYYTDRAYLRFDTLDRRTAKRLHRRGAAQGYRWYALVHPLELDRFKERDLGEWAEIATPGGAHLFELQAESLRGRGRD
jgi:4-amino-4-deoxy-L-arabinose transferase-like glycosyltransferase